MSFDPTQHAPAASPSRADHDRPDEHSRSVVPAASADQNDNPDTTSDDDAQATDGDFDDITAQVEQPAKVMRIGTMIKQLLEEVRSAPLDDAGRRRLREIHESSIRELEQGLAPELRAELERLTIPFGGETPSEAELRVAQAQLVGWLEGLFHGIQTAIYAQQAAARAQLEELRRRALPGAPGGPGGGPDGRQVIVGPNGQLIVPPGARLTPGDDEHGTGQYL